MIFGWGRADDDEEYDDEEERELVSFQGATNGVEVDFKQNARLVEAGLELTKELVTDGIDARAGTVRLDPKPDRATVTHFIDGVPYPGTRLSRPEGLAFGQMLKLLAGLDVKERKKPQSGGIRAEYKGQKYKMYVQTAPTEGGERVMLRIDDPKVPLEKPADLGISNEFKMKLREIIGRKGLFLAVGPPGSGTTTTMYAVLRGLDAFLNQIYYFADVGDRNLELDNISKFVTRPEDSREHTLGRIVRAEANILLVDPLKTPEDFLQYVPHLEKIAIVSEMTAKDAASAVVQLIEWAGDPAVVARAMCGIISQKLVRLLCRSCREAYRPNAQFLKKAGLPETLKVLYRKRQPPEDEDEEEPEPCEKCNDVGYYGRAAMFELIEFTDSMRELVARRPDVAAIKAQMRQEKMLTLQQDGLRLVAEGKTSLEELQRVFKTPS